MYKTSGDYVRLGFEAIFLILLGLNIFRFTKGFKERIVRHKRWKVLEVDSLTDIEKSCRHRKRPEIFRTCGALVRLYTVFELLYFVLALTSIVIWIFYNSIATALDF